MEEGGLVIGVGELPQFFDVQPRLDDFCGPLLILLLFFHSQLLDAVDFFDVLPHLLHALVLCLEEPVEFVHQELAAVVWRSCCSKLLAGSFEDLLFFGKDVVVVWGRVLCMKDLVIPDLFGEGVHSGLFDGEARLTALSITIISISISSSGCRTGFSCCQLLFGVGQIFRQFVSPPLLIDCCLLL